MNSPHIDLSVVIVPYKCEGPLDVTLEAVYASATRFAYEVIIVDNASYDGTVEMVKRKYLSNPDIAAKTKLIENSTNLGFGRGNNIGMKETAGDYILLLNPDTKVAPDNFEVMLEFLKSRPDVGMATSKLIRENGELDWACRRSEATPWVSLTRLIGLQDLFPKSKWFAQYNLKYKPVDEETEIGCCTGAYMMMSRAVFEKTGGFDEDFFMYGEDNDLCFRTRRAGFKIWYYPKTFSYHFKGQSSKKVSGPMLRAFHEGMWVYYKKHYLKKYGKLVGSAVHLAIKARMYAKLIANNFRKEKYVSK
jgi:hypothetical protein